MTTLIDVQKSLIDEALTDPKLIPLDVKDDLIELVSREDFSVEQSTTVLQALIARMKKGAGKRFENLILQARLSTTMRGRFAIPSSELPFAVSDSYLFVIVQEKKADGQRKLRRLHGTGGGGFRRSRLQLEQSNAVLETIVADEQKYANLFSTELSRCSCCGANLTRDESRDAMLGPTCSARRVDMLAASAARRAELGVTV